jgi:hypothetical protein
MVASWEKPSSRTVSRSTKERCSRSRIMGSLERPERTVGQVLFDPDHDSERRVTSSAHDRMPVILDLDAFELWLDPGMKDVVAASERLKPFDARMMRCYPVSTRINHCRQ